MNERTSLEVIFCICRTYSYIYTGLVPTFPSPYHHSFVRLTLTINPAHTLLQHATLHLRQN